MYKKKVVVHSPTITITIIIVVNVSRREKQMICSLINNKLKN